MTGTAERFPRELTSVERELLLWVLPKERPGYSTARSIVEEAAVIGGGRRGEGNYILGKVGRPIDVESPLPQILAYGVVENQEGELTISVREPQGDQLEFEMSHPADKATLSGLKEKRRWTYSEWLPANPCPSCRANVREVVIPVGLQQRLVLAICVRDLRIWVYDNETAVNFPIPVTSLYNELMVQKKIRDPARALNSKRLFSDLHSFADTELTDAFFRYNRLRTRVVLSEPLILTEEKVPGMFRRLMRRVLKIKE